MGVFDTIEEACLQRIDKIKHLLTTGIFTKEELEELKSITDSVYDKHMSKPQ